MTKSGFNYYKADTDRFQDIKIKRLKKTMGCEGYCVYQYALNEIYRVEGAYLEWSDDHVFDCSDYWGISEERVSQIIDYCIEIRLFDASAYAINRTLTSRSIQKRYVDMCKVSKKKAYIPFAIMLVEIEQPAIQEHSESVPETSRNFQKLPESSRKVPEKNDKEKKSKEKNITPSPPLEEDVKSLLSRLEIEARQQYTPPNDGIQRNVNGLMDALRRYSFNPEEVAEVMERCGGGEIGHPIWAIIQEIQSSKQIKFPRRFLLSRLRALNPQAS